MKLGTALDESCPPDFEANIGVEIRLSPRRSFIPDVLVVTREAALRNSNAFQPHEVQLAIEIVSPTSQSTFDTIIETDEPWPISIPIARITPRYL